ncbi:MAG TPA: PQQ-dependent sugar dehydrogenase [Thermoanaerobaculia bacterium]|jgi:glucose/arabinose dehydrogenase|nr:PQQ-dependent sugar dehydrogenase [Thermoanaerobaculia bacterium]
MRRNLFIVVLFLNRFAFANSPPAAPVLLEPAMELQGLNGADVHMVTAQFADEDGDRHRCSDWQIREEQAMVWSSPCAEGPLATHLHLGDGSFTGSHTGVRELRAASRFEVRVRHRDDSGDPETEWSEWTSRRFQTVLPTPIAAMVLRNLVTEPRPLWTLDDTDREDVAIPAGASLALQTVDGVALLRFTDSGIEYGEPRSTPTLVRVRVTSGAEVWSLPQSTVTLEDGDAQPHTVYLPELSLEAESEVFYWISVNGGTHAATAAERTPNFTRIVRGAPVPWTIERGYRIERFASGFELPVSLAAVPHPGDAPDSPFLYVAELYGRIKVLTRSGEIREFASGLLNFDPRAPIPGNGERGIGGIAIDPENGDLIVTGVYQTVPNSPWAAARVLRLQSDDGGRTAARVIPLLEFPNETVAPSHQISTVTFGPDGKLYVHVGSTFEWLSQQTNTIDGKILRVNRDGSAPSENPFYDPGDGITATDYIFAVGFRNPFGGAWRIADGSLYEVENGPSVDRLARVIEGQNYLWDGTDESMRTFAIYNWPQPAAPVQIAFTEPERFGGSGFPEAKLRSAFVTESGATWATGPQQVGKRISEFLIGLDGSLISGPSTFAEYNGSGKATAAGLIAGPEGLFFTDLYKDFGQSDPTEAGANVFRIRWVGTAGFDARFVSPLMIAVADRSDVPDTESISWDFGDGMRSSERNPVHRYRRSGTYLIRQSVSGPRGTVTHARRVFAGGSAAPVVAAYFESEHHSYPTDVHREYALEFDWSDGAPIPVLPNDGFAAWFSVAVTPRFSESYRFTVRSEDRVRLMLDGKLLVDAWEPNGEGKSEAEVPLLAGRSYDISVQFVENSDAPSLQISWESQSQASFVVPRSAGAARRRAVSPP